MTTSVSTGVGPIHVKITKENGRLLLVLVMETSEIANAWERDVRRRYNVAAPLCLVIDQRIFFRISATWRSRGAGSRSDLAEILDDVAEI